MKIRNFSATKLFLSLLGKNEKSFLKQPMTYPTARGFGVKANQRVARKKAAVKRARKLGHA